MGDLFCSREEVLSGMFKRGEEGGTSLDGMVAMLFYVDWSGIFGMGGVCFGVTRCRV